MSALAGVLMDIEGTTTPLSFVHDVLFPYAQTRLPAFCAEHAQDLVMDEVKAQAAGADPLAALQGWMAADMKLAPLKTIQGLIWAEGYEGGALTGTLYPDVPPALRRWVKAGLRLYVYSSGSVAAQRLLFRHSDAGDLSGLFQGFFDTAAGPKRDAGSYASIARGINLAPGELLFLSDVEAELDAAAEASLRTCQLARPEDRTVAGTRHPVAAEFGEVARLFGLPALQ